MLYNLAAYMVMMGVKKTEIRKLVRRLIGKCHVGISWCEELYVLLDNLDMVTANDVDPKPMPSNNTKIKSFNVTCPASGDDPEAVYVLDVCEDALILKVKDQAGGGGQDQSSSRLDYCKYESIVNMTFSPKTKVICIWRRQGELTELHKYKTKKVRRRTICSQLE